MEIKIIKEKISKEELKKIAKENYGHMVKGVVDVEKKIIALGGEFHSDANEVLMGGEGSLQNNVWGFNIYIEKPKEERIEFVSLINIRPADNNFDMEVQDKELKKKIKKIVDNLIK